MRGFSLIELVIVIVIMGIIAAIAIPRVTRGASNAAEAALKADLRTLRNAVEQHKAEHATYPGTSVAADLQVYVGVIPNLSVEPPAGEAFHAAVYPLLCPPNWLLSGSLRPSWMYCPATGNLWANHPAYYGW